VVRRSVPRLYDRLRGRTRACSSPPCDRHGELAACAKHDAPVLARGGGTDLAGQCCNDSGCCGTRQNGHLEPGGTAPCAPRLVVRQESAMVVTELRLPELAMVVGTRAMLGAGVALLLADKVSGSTRKSLGWALVGIGVLTTVPAAMLVLGRRRKVG
jgi:hypothetical protein